eukprot:CCRYP_021127-RA/>CCRYP_021127-RA protein AED:0.00 eAED:0.00 QI:1726/1/1/1/1/1/2/428/272
MPTRVGETAVGPYGNAWNLAHGCLGGCCVPPINTRSRIDQPYIRSTAAESLYSGSPGPEPRQDIRRVHNAPSRTSGGTGHPGAVVPNSSPTCVTDMSTFPSWVDAKNPPAWYNEGSDIDTLLEDAECLNWLSDTGDLDETYPPAVAIASTAVTTEPSMDFEPTPVNVHPYEYAYHGNMDSHSPHPTLAEIHEEPIDPTLVHDPITHPSVESLSFLVDSPKQGMDEMTSFLHDENHAHHAPKHCLTHLPPMQSKPFPTLPKSNSLLKKVTTIS